MDLITYAMAQLSSGGGGGSNLPPVTSDDNGDVLTVVEGQWDKAVLPTELPTVSSSDNGKILKVIEGVWSKGNDSTGGDIVVVTATPIQNDDDHVTLSVTTSQINTYLSDGKTVFIDYIDGQSNKQRYSLISKGDGWAFIFLRNNWDLITDEPYLECGRILRGNNNDPYVADYGYVTYPLDSGYTEVTGTLTAGNTTLTLSNVAITTTSTIDVYTDTFGVNPTNIVVANGSVTLTFAAQLNNLGVKVRIS